MPGQKRKYNVRFPPGRIKKIIQKDTEVGKMAAAVPVIISRAVELFVKSLLTKTCQITQLKHSRVLSVTHMKECVESEKLFDFLRDLTDHAVSTQREPSVKAKWPLNRRTRQDLSGRANQHEAGGQSNIDTSESSSDMDSELYICLGAQL